MSDDLNFTFSLDDIPHFSFGMPDDETLARYIAIKGEKGDNGDGDMSSSVYDTNHNGIVDNAEKVNNHTVASDVPADAVFTDTIYDDTDIRADLNDKVDTADLATVATSGSYADLSNKPTIPTNVSDLTNDSGYQTASDVSTAIAGKISTGNVQTSDIVSGAVTAAKIDWATVGGAIYPVGSIVTFYDTADHSNFLGLTWARVGAGKMIVGYDSTDTDFNTIGATGGSKTHQHNLSDNGYAKIVLRGNGDIRYKENPVPSWQENYYVLGNGGLNGSEYQTYGAELGGTTDSANGMPPYLVASLWRRTA